MHTRTHTHLRTHDTRTTHARTQTHALRKHWTCFSKKQATSTYCERSGTSRAPTHWPVPVAASRSASSSLIFTQQQWKAVCPCSHHAHTWPSCPVKLWRGGCRGRSSLRLRGYAPVKSSGSCGWASLVASKICHFLQQPHALIWVWYLAWCFSAWLTCGFRSTSCACTVRLGVVVWGQHLHKPLNYVGCKTTPSCFLFFSCSNSSIKVKTCLSGFTRKCVGADFLCTFSCR